jgi:hypothetical protein
MTPKPSQVAVVLAISLTAATVAAQPPKKMSGDALAIACGPAVAFEMPKTSLTISGSLTDAKGVFAPWHRLLVKGGSDQGVKTGQEFYVRRAMPPKEVPPRGERPVIGIATIGWIRIDQAQSDTSIASVVHECDGIEEGDYLEPFATPSVPAPLPDGSPDFTATGTVLFGAERRQIEGSNALMVVDLGEADGIKPGQRFTIFRASAAGPNVIIARATAMRVGSDTSLVKIGDMRDAVMVGDRVAPHK